MTHPHPSSPPSRIAASRSVVVRAPGRLHLGFMDPGASLGRRFGSLGLVIEDFETMAELRLAEQDGWSAPADAEASDLTRALAHLPAHAGFGSGTQLALAVGHAFARLHGLPLSSEQLARWLGRGLRSGIGIAGFDQGGLLLDGGPGAADTIAPLLSRLDFPEAWRVIIVMDPGHAGLSGAEEKRAIASLPPFPREAAAEVCHQTLMQVLPGAATGDFSAFAHGVTRVQQLLGAHFAPAQGGSMWTSARVGRLLDWMAERSTAAIGQSSWGPSGFAVLPGALEAQALLHQAAEAGLIEPGLQVHTVRGRNRGADFDPPPPAAAALSRA